MPNSTDSMSSNDLFPEFPPVSKADWLQQIAKDLKDKSMEDLVWQRADGLKVSPFVHADDFPVPPTPLSGQRNSWEICEEIVVTDPVSANRQAMQALEGGVEALCFRLDAPLGAEAFRALMAGIYLQYIGLHFNGKAVADNPGMVLGNLELIARENNLSPASLRGSLAYNPVPVSRVVDWRYLADLIQFAKENFPQFKLIQIADTGEGRLADLLQQANVYFEHLEAKGISIEDVTDVLAFSVNIDKSYFYEISRLRALKLLYFNILNAWKAPIKPPVVFAVFRPESYTDDLYTNMIRATTMAMSAVQGGVDTLTVLPYDSGRESQASYPQQFGRRIARNVQHLLKMESALDDQADPAAGSYYVETLTRQLVEEAWQHFTEKR